MSTSFLGPGEDSEDRLRIAMLAADVGTWRVDLQTGLDTRDASLNRILGLEAMDSTQSSDDFYSRIQSEDRPQAEATWKAAREEAGAFDLEVRIVRPDGKVRWIRYRGRFVLSELPFATGVVVDVTERKMAEEALGEREERIQSLLDSTAEGIYGLDPNGNCTFANAACVKMLGYDSPYDLIGRNMHGLIHHHYEDGRPYPIQECRIFQSFRTGERIHVDQEVLWRQDGSRFPAEYWSYPVRRQGRIVGSVVTFLDGTDRLQAQRDLVQSQQFLQSTIDSLTSHIAVLDEQGTILMVNEAWRQFAKDNGFSCRNFGVGKNYLAECKSTRADQEAVKAGNAIREVLEGDRSVSNLEYPCHSSSEQRWFLMRVTRFSEEGLVRVVVAHENITQRRLAEMALQDADRRKNEFLAVLAHELRNPLAPLQNAMSLLTAKVDGQEFDQTVELMKRQLGQLVHLVDDLLDVSRISRGKIVIRKKRTDLKSVIDCAIETIRPAMDRMNHKLALTVSPEPIYLTADPTRLAQVIGNLLNNACKFTEPGGRIGLVVERVADQAQIRVQDNGIGIAADQVGRIFDMFAQVDGSLERSTTGLGIGLTLVKSLVEMHGGKIEVHSAGLGKGSEFVVHLPLTEETEAALEKPSEGPNRVTPLQILVVDDNRDMASSLALLLRRCGHTVYTAHDGLEAVQSAGQFQPRVILLDIGLPKLNGYDTARAIRDQHRNVPLALIAVTGLGQVEDRQRAINAGFDAHIVKPVDFDELMQLLCSLGSNL